MVSGEQVVAGISTLVAALFAIYAYQVSIPSGNSGFSVTSAGDQFEGDSGEFCPVSTGSGNSKCGEGGGSDDGFSNMGDTKTGSGAEPSSIYDLSYTSIDGTTESMNKYRGHVLIVVNVASKCSYTCVNYEQLTELYSKYAESQGLRILAFPCNQFMGQEPLGEKEIKEFAATYNVRYDMSAKVDVNGASTHPVWAFLKKQQGGFIGDFVKWNFTKFLVDKKGNVVKRYGPTTNPKELEKDLLELFKQSS